VPIITSNKQSVAGAI